MRLFRRPERITASTVALLLFGIVVAAFVIVGSWLTIASGKFSAEAWQTFIVAGIALGAVYALIAIGYTLVYGILFMINFAHGEVFMSGAYTAVFAAQAMADAGFVDSNPLLAFLVCLVIAMAVSMAVAIVLERVAYRPLRNAPRLVPLITAIGASLFLQYTFRGLYGASVHAYPTFSIFQGNWVILGITLPISKVVVSLASVGLMVGLYLFVERTRTGRAMRAVSENKEVAAMMGIDVDRVIVITFAIGGLRARPGSSTRSSSTR